MGATSYTLTRVGLGGKVQFNRAFGVAVAADGTAYVADRENHRIRKVTAAGVVTTLAGDGTQGFKDDPVGTAAQFYNPSGVAVDADAIGPFAPAAPVAVYAYTAGSAQTYTVPAGVSTLYIVAQGSFSVPGGVGGSSSGGWTT